MAELTVFLHGPEIDRDGTPFAVYTFLLVPTVAFAADTTRHEIVLTDTLPVHERN